VRRRKPTLRGLHSSFSHGSHPAQHSSGARSNSRNSATSGTSRNSESPLLLASPPAPSPLTSFAGDSVVEVFAASAIVWLFSAGRGHSTLAERRAQQLVAGSYFVLVAYIVSHSLYDLIAGSRPSASWLGIGLAAFTAPTMPLLARAKRKVGRALNSSATVSEAGQNQICAYLSIALLLGLLLNAVANWWWADPAAAFVIAAFALREGRESWRGNACDCC
jgi:hypothetical protein